MRYLLIMLLGVVSLTLGALVSPSTAAQCSMFVNDQGDSTPIAPNCEITLNGKACAFRDIPEGATVSITVENGVVVRITATTESLPAFSMN